MSEQDQQQVIVEVHFILDRPGHNDPEDVDRVENLWWALPFFQAALIVELGQGRNIDITVPHTEADPPGRIIIRVLDEEYAKIDKKAIKYGFYEKYESGDEYVMFWLVDWDIFFQETLGWATPE